MDRNTYRGVIDIIDVNKFIYELKNITSKNNASELFDHEKQYIQWLFMSSRRELKRLYNRLQKKMSVRKMEGLLNILFIETSDLRLTVYETLIPKFNVVDRLNNNEELIQEEKNDILRDDLYWYNCTKDKFGFWLRDPEEDEYICARELFVRKLFDQYVERTGNMGILNKFKG